MSRYTYFDENEEEKIVIIKEGCRYKTNKICYSNKDWKKYGKKCYWEGNCVHFLAEKEVDK